MMNVDISKYESDVVENLDKENVLKIVTFLKNNNCDYIDELLENPDELKKMSAASLKLGKPQAADEIADLILNLAKKN